MSNQSIERLPVLTPAEYDEIRDIVIPVNVDNHSKVTMDSECIEHAIAYVGDVQARRIYDPANPDRAMALHSILRAITGPMEAGRRRFHMEHEGNAYRAQVGARRGGVDVTLRAIPKETPHLNDITMPDAWREFLLSQDLLNGGLVIISGQNGNGKTTTAAATVRSRLEKFGGHANVIEDPVELPLDGPCTGAMSGYCTQRPADMLDQDGTPGSGYRQALYEAARQFPSFTGGGTILMIGEIRDEDTAMAAINGAVAGHLVISTVHSPSAAGAVARVASLASMKAGVDAQAIRELLSVQLTGVLHQRLAYIGKAGNRDANHWKQAEVRGEVLIRDEANLGGSKVGDAIFKGITGEKMLTKYSSDQTAKINHLTGDQARWIHVKKMVDSIGGP